MQSEHNKKLGIGYGSVQTEPSNQTYNQARLIHVLWETPMTDVYVYYFVRAGGKILSKRRATLATIKHNGEPVMESQLVVDDTEVDNNGFLMDGVDDHSQSMDEHWSQVRSLEKRAASRESEAQGLNECTDGNHKYNLRLESRELRKQAQKLKKLNGESSAAAESAGVDAQGLVQLEGSA
jgi:hypothetical protein